jgi:transcriptional regulator with XRE-family HTH domain
MGSKNSRRHRPTAYIQLVPDPKGPTGDSLDLFSTELGNDGSPLANRGGADAQRPRDIRSALKVIDNVLLEHEPSLTVVQSRMQPQSKRMMLTSVQMERFSTLAERLTDAMGDKITASDLARSCDVSPAAVSKWLDGRTKALKAETLAAAARALGVREDWLRTGKLPREREGAEEDRQLERVMGLLEELRGPLAALAGAIDALSKARSEPQRKRAKA